MFWFAGLLGSNQGRQNWTEFNTSHGAQVCLSWWLWWWYCTVDHCWFCRKALVLCEYQEAQIGPPVFFKEFWVSFLLSIFIYFLTNTYIVLHWFRWYIIRPHLNYMFHNTINRIGHFKSMNPWSFRVMKTSIYWAWLFVLCSKRSKDYDFEGVFCVALKLK